MRYQRDLSEISPCIRVGQKLINVGLLALIGGGAITKVALGDQLGKGVPPMLWWILIPIWSTIVIGGCLCMAGWIRFPAAAPLLSLPYERDASGRAVSPIIKASMALLSFIMLAISGALAFEQTQWYQSLALYWMFCCSGFGLFLTTIYSEKQFPVTTTYGNALLFIFALVWIPIAWPLVVAFEVREAWNSKARHSLIEDGDPSKTVWQNILNLCQSSLGQVPRQFNRTERLTYLHIPEPKWLRS